MTPLLYEVRNLVCSYQGKRVVEIGRLDIAADGPTAFVGHNGSGKSTLFRALAFLLKPESGSLTFLGQPVEGREEQLRRDVTMLLQDPYLLRRSVFDNVAYGLKARGERRGVEDRVVEALEVVGLSADFAAREWYQLSGGESRRVALASRLVLRTKALLLDEPTANVDEENGSLIAEAVRNAWSRWGVVPLVASHDLPWLDEVTDRRVLMKRGRIQGADESPGAGTNRPVP